MLRFSKVLTFVSLRDYSVLNSQIKFQNFVRARINYFECKRFLKITRFVPLSGNTPALWLEYLPWRRSGILPPRRLAFPQHLAKLHVPGRLRHCISVELYAINKYYTRA